MAGGVEVGVVEALVGGIPANYSHLAEVARAPVSVEHLGNRQRPRARVNLEERVRVRPAAVGGESVEGACSVKGQIDHHFPIEGNEGRDRSGCPVNLADKGVDEVDACNPEGAVSGIPGESGHDGGVLESWVGFDEGGSGK